MGRYTAPFSSSQEKFLAIMPKISAILSILGATCIVVHVIRTSSINKRSHINSTKKCTKSVYYRIILLMSIMDILFGIKCFLSTWIIPANYNTNSYMAIGTTATCTATAFMSHGAGISSALYSCTLTIYYLLTIVYGWKLDIGTIKTKKWKIKEILYFHTVPLFIGWTTALAGIPLKLFNPIGWTCCIGYYPSNCNKNGNCIRGENAELYQWLFFHGILWVCSVFLIVSMIIIYKSIRTIEQAGKRFQFAAAERTYSITMPTNNKNAAIISNNKFGNTGSFRFSSTNNNIRQQQQVRKERILSRQFANQAILYIVAFLVTWIFPEIQFVIVDKTVNGESFFPSLALIVIVLPLQGLWNALIFFRPRYISYIQKQEQIRKRQEQQKQLKQLIEQQQQEEQDQQGQGHQQDKNTKNSSKDETVSTATTSSRLVNVVSAVMHAISVTEDDDDDDDHHGDLDNDSTDHLDVDVNNDENIDNMNTTTST